jgi:hypothetical protein
MNKNPTPIGCKKIFYWYIISFIFYLELVEPAPISKQGLRKPINNLGNFNNNQIVTNNLSHGPIINQKLDNLITNNHSNIEQSKNSTLKQDILSRFDSSNTNILTQIQNQSSIPQSYGNPHLVPSNQNFYIQETKSEDI